jgi:hypothetical protein
MPLSLPLSLSQLSHGCVSQADTPHRIKNKGSHSRAFFFFRIKMDRQIVYPGAIPLETDILNTNRSVLSSIGSLIGDTLGTATQFTGLGCVPSIPAALTVVINPGVAYSLQNLDNTPYSSLPQDTAHQIMKQGIMQNAQTFSTPAPGTSGFSINYLVSAAFVEADINPVVLPYYNAANPAQAFSGPGGNGASNNTTRQNTVQLTLTPGVAALTGTQVTPATPVGTTALYVVTVAFGQTTVTALNIAKVSGAPFFPGFVRVDGSTPFTAVQTGVAPAANDSSAAFVTSAWVMRQGTGVVGLVRNLSARLTTAGASIIFTAAEIQVESVLIGGLKATLSNLNVTFNGAGANGANGMDTGSMPASGFVGIYAIYNPTTSTAAVLGVNASSLLNETYTGANMPAGYTMSALLTVLPTNASSLIVPCVVLDRSVDIANVTAMSTNTVAASPTIVNNTAVPLNAKTFSGSITAGNTAASTVTLTIYSSVAGTALQTVGIATTGAASNQLSLTRMKISTPQRMFYSATSTTGTPTFTVITNSYEI